MTAWLYILRSESSGRFYVGSTNNLERRLSEHARQHSPATRGRGPWRLVYTQLRPTLAAARRREREIKSWKSSKLIAQLIREAKG